MASREDSRQSAPETPTEPASVATVRVPARAMNQRLQDAQSVRSGARVRQKLLRNPTAIAGMAILVIVVLTAIGAPLIAPGDPTLGNIINRLEPPVWSKSPILGTDQLGRDLFSRIVFGARVSLVVGGLSVLFAATIGVGLGLSAGYFGGKLDNLIMRVADVQLAFPFILLALAIVAVLGPSIRNLIIVFSVTSWVVYARTIRGSVLSVREMEYIQASRAIGASNFRIVTRHIFRNVASPLIVIASFELAKIIIYEASLSFLGLGVQPPTPSWGSMLADGRGYVETAWWIGVFPGVALMLTVLAVNFIGDALRDALDPSLSQL